MLRVAILSILISFSYGGYVDKFVGNYVIAATFPEDVGFPSCDLYSFKIRNRVNCECFHRKDLKLLEFGIPNSPETSDLAIIDVTGTNNIDHFLTTPKCSCGNIDYKNLVVIHIDDNFFAYFELYKDLIKNETITMVNVFSKIIPSNESLDTAIKSVPNLRDRKYKITCSTDLKPTGGIPNL